MFPWPFRPVWARDTRGTCHRHREYAIQFYDFDSGEITELYRKEGPFQHAWLAVSPDGAWVLHGEAPMGTSELMLVENFR